MSVANRIYRDFLMPSRLDDYRRTLEMGLEEGFSAVSVERFWQLLADSAVQPDARYLVVRHDIDSDPRTAAQMWDVDRSLGIRGSFYFRLATLDLELMASIGAAGGEVSYHYEDLATVAKRQRARTAEDARSHLPEARESFARNLESLRKASGLSMRVVASHGDFVNRRLGVANWEILDDPAFRRQVGVDLEVYDDSFMRHVSSRHCDAGYPNLWESPEPLSAVRRHEHVVYLLVHPRHWQVNRVVNLHDDALRLQEDLAYRMPIKGARRA